ncbi:MAG: LacI family transcriptional regulator [Nocardioidaceae bacterium]|jgi:LacI family transcriptional regulator|nr:LacI family transcriptional regulator [Nocardioidaceae bacterium]
MDGQVGIKDVASRAGVSTATVSNVLNRPHIVAPATRDRVLAAISALGFIRNESARQLRAGRSRFIGLVVLDVTNPFFTDVARGAEDLANEFGLAVILCNSDEQPARETRYLDLLEQHRVRGILITPTGSNPHRLDEIRARGIPVVLVDRHARRGRCSVSVDDVHGGDLAATHLLERGHRRLAFVGGPFTLHQVQDRLDGALQSLKRAGLDESALHIEETPALNVASGMDAAARLAERPAHQRPTAVFCANDLVALGVLQELTRRHIAVPEEIAIMGYDDIAFAASAAVPLTSVRQPRAQLGRAAAELLIEESRADGHHKHRQVVFEPELVVRGSTDMVHLDGRAGLEMTVEG